MQSAKTYIIAVKTGMSVSAAAAEFNVPKSLYDQISGMHHQISPTVLQHCDKQECVHMPSTCKDRVWYHEEAGSCQLCMDSKYIH